MNSIGSLPKSNTYEGPTLPELTAGKALITVAILIAGVAGLCKFFGTSKPASQRQMVFNPPRTYTIQKITRLAPPKSSSWIPRKLSEEKAIAKMQKNLWKAVTEHHIKYNGENNPYVKWDEIVSDLETQNSQYPLNFSATIATSQGPRKSMEDAHFFVKIDQGILLGVFDGHAGDKAAKFASNYIQKNFSTELTNAQGNVHQAFESIFHNTQSMIMKTEEIRINGSTAVVCFIQDKTNIAYTATIGDSEMNLYRKIEGKMRSIPLSVIRDWSDTKEATRAAIAMNRSLQEANHWVGHHDSKSLRLISADRDTLNVSRAFGDKPFRNYSNNPGIIHKPKITAFPIKPGDYLVETCDGLTDYVPENRIKDCVSSNPSNLAALLVNVALLNMTPDEGDNITVIALRVSS